MSTTRSRRINREGRQLRSDVLLVKLAGDERWLQFRDVFEVDRRPVRDRDQRLFKLFVDAKADARAQAQTIQNESSRYNLGPVTRTINIPIMAMLFFEKGNQLRAIVDVSYKAAPGLDFLVPGEMREIYTVRQNEIRIDGRATYDKFRQFSVSMTEKPKD